MTVDRSQEGNVVTVDMSQEGNVVTVDRSQEGNVVTGDRIQEGNVVTGAGAKSVTLCIPGPCYYDFVFHSYCGNCRWFRTPRHG